MSRLALLLLFLVGCQTSVQSEPQTDVSIAPDPKPDPQPEDAPEPVPPTPKETVEKPATPSCAPWEKPVLSAHTKTDDHLPTGIASGAVRANRATLWTRSSHKGRVRALVSAGPECPV